MTTSKPPFPRTHNHGVALWKILHAYLTRDELLMPCDTLLLATTCLMWDSYINRMKVLLDKSTPLVVYGKSDVPNVSNTASQALDDGVGLTKNFKALSLGRVNQKARGDVLEVNPFIYEDAERKKISRCGVNAELYLWKHDSPPDWFSAKMKRQWWENRVAIADWYQPQDWPLITQQILVYNLFVMTIDLEQHITDDECVSPYGKPVRNPAVAIRKQCTNTLHALASMMASSPYSRRLAKIEEEPDEDAPVLNPSWSGFDD